MIKPIEIRYIKKNNILSLTFEDGLKENLTIEYLRCFSPSAEVRGHGPGQEKLQKGKEDVRLDKIEPVGNYAVKLVFDDGHDSGIFTWDYLFELGSNHSDNWANYLQRLHQANQSRDPDTQVVKLS